MERLVCFLKDYFIAGIKEIKPASKSSDTSDITIIALYVVGVIVTVDVTGMMIRNRIHKSN